jgi:hypothetical protein
MPKITLTCVQCNRPFQVWPYRLRGNVKFCSRACKSIAMQGKLPPNRADLVERVFGALTVIAFDCAVSGHTVWRCKCNCGNETCVRNGGLQSGSVKSCGCLKRRTGEQSPNWRRGFTISTNGYKHVLTSDPDRTNRYQPEHRLVMAEALGRPLTCDEVVHHINRDKTDNRLENLEVLSRQEHAALHAAEDRLCVAADATKGPYKGGPS